MFYKLDENKNAIPCEVLEWGEQLEEMSISGAKIVANEEVNGKIISTVWLGVNHSYNDGFPPLIFETMIFEGDSCWDIYCDRYSSWDEALAGHQKAIRWVKNGCKNDESIDKDRE